MQPRSLCAVASVRQRLDAEERQKLNAELEAPRCHQCYGGGCVLLCCLAFCSVALFSLFCFVLLQKSSGPPAGDEAAGGGAPQGGGLAGILPQVPGLSSPQELFHDYNVTIRNYKKQQFIGGLRG